VTPAEAKQKETPWWTESRKVIVGWMFALLLTPVSVWLSTYFTDRYKAPIPSLEEISASPLYFVNEPDREFANQITADPLLGYGFRAELRQASLSPEMADKCIGWLDHRDWQADCAQIYVSVLNSTHSALKRMTFELRRGGPRARAVGPNGFETLIQETPEPERLQQAEEADSIATRFSTSLSEVLSRRAERSGGTSFTVGVLNKGDSDGTVFSGATLSFAGHELDVYAGKYTVVKAHSFEEIEFSTGTNTVGQEKMLQQWEDAVKQGKELKYKLEITLSDRKASIEASVPAEAQ
jgi:hypothetical protein